MKKGLRRFEFGRKPMDGIGIDLALMKKGLRPHLNMEFAFPIRIDLALMKKGLRHKPSSQSVKNAVLTLP